MNRWTSERMAQARSLRAKGHTMAETAALMNTTKGAVSGALHRKSNGVKVSVWTEENTKAAADMKARGLTSKAIAAHLGESFTAARVRAKLHRRKVRDYKKENAARQIKRASVKKIERGSWDEKLFEPYAAFKARKAMERASCNG